MKRFVSLLVALVLCLGMAVPAFAATDTFVPSIGYKDGPDVEDADLNGEDVGDCIVVSSIKQCKDQTTDIFQEDRDLLLDVYKQLEDGTMKLPLEDGYVVRELVDVSFRKSACIEKEHGHKEWLKEEGNTIKITFDLGIKKDTDVKVLVYLNGEWTPAKEVVNNGDKTITVEFEDICPVAFCVDADAEVEPPKTGDVMGTELLLWIVLMAVSCLAIVVLVANRRKFAR